MKAIQCALEDDLRFEEILQGHVGWAHPTVRCVDRVALLEGCSLLVILRPSSLEVNGQSTFSVVGDAYMAGWMYRELWPLQSEEVMEKIPGLDGTTLSAPIRRSFLWKDHSTELTYLA